MNSDDVKQPEINLVDLPIREDLLVVKQEIKLWRTVLDKALFDLLNSKGDDGYDAAAFFRWSNQDFHDVCFLAQIKPWTVYRFAWELVRRYKDGTQQGFVISRRNLGTNGAGARK